jgi:hypothetical protein
MSEKKNQHLVPACYLRNFEADVSEIRKVNSKFCSGIYINNKKLTGKWNLRSVLHKSLTKSYFYNLPEDDPQRPLIENYLSIVESDYVRYIKQIIEGKVNNENLSFMSYFVTLQFMRVEAFIDRFQSAFDKVAGWMDMYEGNDKYKNALKDISKRQLAAYDLGHIIHPYAVIIYNDTNFPFITSDNPVVRRQINISGALKIIPRKCLPENANESIESACFFLPLSPKVAYISCELIKSSGNLFYSESDLENIFYLNYSSIVNAYEKVFSPIIEPVKCEVDLVRFLANKNQTIVKIYTESRRVISSGTIADDTDFKISLRLDDIQKTKIIEDGEQVKLVEVIENGQSIRHIRECKVSSIDYENGLVTIESNIQLSI